MNRRRFLKAFGVTAVAMVGAKEAALRLLSFTGGGPAFGNYGGIAFLETNHPFVAYRVAARHMARSLEWQSLKRIAGCDDHRHDADHYLTWNPDLLRPPHKVFHQRKTP